MKMDNKKLLALRSSYISEREKKIAEFMELEEENSSKAKTISDRINSLTDKINSLDETIGAHYGFD